MKIRTGVTITVLALATPPLALAGGTEPTRAEARAAIDTAKQAALEHDAQADPADEQAAERSDEAEDALRDAEIKFAAENYDGAVKEAEDALRQLQD